MATATASMDSAYNLRGLNMITPDQIVDLSADTKGQSPFAPNSRILAPQVATDPRTAIESRNGAGVYTIPVGEAQELTLNAGTGLTDFSITDQLRFVQPFTPTSSKALSAVDIKLKRPTGTSFSVDDTVVQIVTLDGSGNPQTVLATSSVRNGLVTFAYQMLKARFIQAPTLTSGTTYGIVIFGANSGINFISLGLSAGTAGKQSIDGGVTWTANTLAANYTTYMATPGTVKGHIRWVTKDGIKQSLFAQNDSIYYVTNESTGAIATLKTGLSTIAKRVRFIPQYDKLAIVNGYDAEMKWDGTTLTTLTHTTAFPIPENIIMFHDRAWYTYRDNPTLTRFSGIYPDLEKIDSVNYQYIPDTASTDPIVGGTVFQNQLVFFTKNSKYLITGDDVSTLGVSQSPGGTKGAVSQEAIANAETVVYFLSQDGGAYYYDGAQDHAISDPVQPLISAMSNVDEIDSLVWNKQWRIYYKTSGDAAHKRMLLYDLRYNEWLNDTETYTRLPVAWKFENNVLVEASSTIGALYFGESQQTHLGDYIRWRYWTNYKPYTSGIAKDRVKTFRAIFATPTRTISVKVGKDADFANAPAVKTVTLTADGILYNGGSVYGGADAYYGKGSRVSQPKVSLSGRANNTQYRFEKDVLYTKVRLFGYEAIVKSSRAR